MAAYFITLTRKSDYCIIDINLAHVQMIIPLYDETGKNIETVLYFTGERCAIIVTETLDFIRDAITKASIINVYTKDVS